MRRLGRVIGSWPFYVSVLVITTLAVASGILLFRINSDRILQKHVCKAMRSTATIQAEVIHREMEEQFIPLKLITDFIQNDDSFRERDNRLLMDVLQTENRFCLLGFADLSGNAINSEGELMGNIAERRYFTSVAGGETENCVEYLPVTKLVDEPRFLFSVPVRVNGDLIGVLFASKKASVISDVLLSGTFFDGSERIYIVDPDNGILATNAGSVEEKQQRDLSEELAFVKDRSRQGQAANGFIRDNNIYIVSIPVGVNDWELVCILDKENAEEIYEDFGETVRDIANTITLILSAAMAYTVLMTQYRINRYRKGETQLFRQYSTYRTLLEKMDCAVVEYDVRSDTLTANRLFMDKYAGMEPENRPLTLKRLREIHPEFIFTELDEVIRNVRETKRPGSFETAILYPDGKIYWIEVLLMPQMDLHGSITEILAAIIDTTGAHESRDSVETMSNAPSGIYRCCLNDPIHMEFASKGMFEMLGYTEEAFFELLTPDRKPGRLVHPDDMETFEQFLRKASQNEGRHQCEYRLRKADGSYIPVLDMMDTKRAASGVMYGYSSVTDITEFQQAKEIANAKLRAAEEEIEKHITKERKIIAAKEEAEQKYRKEALQLLEKSNMEKEEANRLVRAISSINSDYSAIYFVDLNLDRYQICRATEMLRAPVRETILSKNCFSTTMQFYIHTFVIEEDQERMLKDTEIDAIKNRLSTDNQFFLRFRLKENSDRQFHYEMHVVDCSTGPEEYMIAVGFRCLDAAIAEEKRRRQEVEVLEDRLKNAQLKNSMSQMQPHFLYNALASIREVVLEDPQYASDLIYDFSTHLRACIRAMSHSDLVPFEQELENIRAYVNIEKMRFGDKLQVRFDIRDRDFAIVPLSIQPLVENSIRHGIYERGSDGGTVTVATRLTETHHEITVTDDGVGFDYAMLQKEIDEKKRDSTGLANLVFRLKNVMKATVAVDSKPGAGTVITVSVPFEQKFLLPAGESS